ncbi:MAG: pilus assembly protein PilM, partial [Candidatus Omnitrophica bacterium]|nr:pilus assembly protein PilM [Candidatus Omnitrophota bacterium]
MKIEKGLDLPAVSSAMESLQREVQNSLDYWRYTIKGQDINEIYVCGGAAKMNGFSEAFSNKTGVPFHTLNPLEFIGIDPKYKEILKEKGPELSIACGIALRQLKSTFIDLDMTPFELIRIKEFKSSIPYIFISLLFAVLLIITPGFFLNEKKIVLQNFSKQVDASLKGYEKYKPDVDKLEASISSIENNISTAKELLKKKSIWLERILEIGNTLPSSRIYLISITPGRETSKKSSAPGVPSAPGMPPVAPGMPPGAPGMPPGAPGMPPGVPGMPPASGAQAPASVAKSSIPVSSSTLTLKGEVIVTNLKTAFNDLETFVQKLSTIKSFSSVTISSVELNKANNKLRFTLLVQLK